MSQWIHVALIAASVGCVSTLVLVFIWRWCRQRGSINLVEPDRLSTVETLQAGIASRHHQPTVYHQFDQLRGSKNRGNIHVFRRGVSGRPLFNWADHPTMAADAIENGWSRFAFTSYKSYMPFPSKRSSLFGACAAGDNGKETETDIRWEVSQESADFMQKIRLNSGLIRKFHSNDSSMAVAAVITTALPLPGPPQGNYSFPQEAYFEITILYSGAGDSESIGKVREGEKTKLIQDHSNAKGNSEASMHVTSSHKINNVDELKLDGKDSGKTESAMFSLGLTTGGSLPLRVPGSYPGSIGFNSNGSVCLDGIKLVFESEKAEWVATDKVIGCGFDPRQKKVFFTLDSELVHVVRCQSEEFGCPLYPTLAANIDILVSVNYGQSTFKYAPANAQRTPNPCFIAPLVNSPAATLGYEDSKELFSMGRIDSQWLNRSLIKGGHSNRVVDFDEESEADLFEIVLDGTEKSQKTAS
ncbi:hypothetical protein L6164_024636 [Bauhinia variegata]|uniref:Uncharacterized protein n=1 Tax=Bauhinia variegata TaxID=167791 RepID=A0ACB9LYZ6_BAUVA|nr:hypothetical protein L6164_024636 [Bauhinia variegata]